MVVSAPGKRYSDDNKVTDLLYLCKTHVDHNIPVDHIFQVICDRFKIMEVNLEVAVDIGAELEEIRTNLKPGVTADYIASRGEYLCGKLTAAYLGFDFVDPAGLIKFDEKGRYLADETQEALSAELAKHEKAVIPGFYGSDVYKRQGVILFQLVVAWAVTFVVYHVGSLIV